MPKSHPPRDIRERRQRGPRKKKHPQWDWKFWAGFLATVVLGLAALWLTVDDRPTIAIGPQLDSGNILSAEITIVNKGVLSIRNVSIDVYMKHAKLFTRDTSVNNLIAERYVIPTGVLRPDEPKVIYLGGLLRPSSQEPLRYRELDFALIVNFNPAWAPFWNRTRVFRFMLGQSENGEFLQQVPDENIEDEFRQARSKLSD